MICVGATRFNSDKTTTDLSKEFVQEGKVYLTYDPDTGAYLDLQLKNLPLGTLIAIKSFSVQHGLYIKAVGILSDLPTKNSTNSRAVKWLWSGNIHFGRLNDKLDNMRSGAMYTELNPELQKKIIELI